MKRGISFVTIGLICAVPFLANAAGKSAPPKLEYYRLVPGFMAEVKNAMGFPAGPAGTGFATANPWGQYTAYLMATNAKGQRTWRIEHNLPQGNGRAQGSTMYLLEGSKRALLIDTANPAKFTLGVDDLKTVVRHLLGHTNSGAVKPDPLDFVVANSHSHGDHTGENVLMNDRTIYYMDLDWPPRGDTTNYVPIREGGGATKNGNGMAVGEIDLGDRMIKAIAMPPHTKGSTGYLDAENLMLFTGDAMGSAWPYIQGGPMTTYAATTRHVDEVTKPYPGIAVLPAHFYQTESFGRKEKPLGRAYLLDQEKNAAGILSGERIGIPFYAGGRNTYWARTASAQTVYSPNTLYAPGETPDVAYHAVHIPGGPLQRLDPNPALEKVWDIRADFYLIHASSGENLFLLKGSKLAVLIGTGAGAPGLDKMIARLAGKTPLAVVLSDGDPDQIGGLAQLHPRMVYGAPQLASQVKQLAFTAMHDGDKIDLGADKTGKALVLQVQTLTGHSDAGLTLIDTDDRLLFGGDALGAQGAELTLNSSLKDFADAFGAWRQKTDGQYDVVYMSHNSQWFTDPAYVSELSDALKSGLTQGPAGVTKSSGKPDVAASVRWAQ